MADFRDIYKTPLLSAKTLGKAVKTGAIFACYPETVTGSDKKSQDRIIIELDEGDTRIALNKGNASQLASVFGRDYNEWVGKKVKVVTKKVDYMGKATDGLDVQPIKK